MSYEELVEWSEFFKLRSELEKKARDKAKNERKAKSGAKKGRRRR